MEILNYSDRLPANLFTAQKLLLSVISFIWNYTGLPVFDLITTKINEKWKYRK